MKNREERQEAIKGIISENVIKSQEFLLDLLKDEGFHLTQATLSRDLKALKIAKMPSPDGGYQYILPEDTLNNAESFGVNANFLADGFVSIEFSGNMAVIKTRPAYASSIAAVIDSANETNILGTIAGDDTILLILREGFKNSQLKNTLTGIMPKLKGKLNLMHD